MPLARRYPLNVLRAALVEVTARQRRPLMIEYLLLDGLNDTDEDVAALRDYLANLPVRMNLVLPTQLTRRPACGPRRRPGSALSPRRSWRPASW